MQQRRFKVFLGGNSPLVTWRLGGDSPCAETGEEIITGDVYINDQLGCGGRLCVSNSIQTDKLRVQEVHFTNTACHKANLAPFKMGFSGTSASNSSWTMYSGLDEVMTLLGNGNLGIGVTNPEHKLDVCGIIRANEVRVRANWCDYVFDSDYALPTLSEVEAFIQKHHHLPDVPSGTVIEDKGVPLGEMQAIHMKKIEELTLYMIEMNKKIEELEIENKELRTIIEEGK